MTGMVEACEEQYGDEIASQLKHKVLASVLYREAANCYQIG